MKTSSKYVIIFDLETGGLCSKDKLAFYDVPIVESAMVVVDMEKLEISHSEIEALLKFEDEYFRANFSLK